MRARALLSLGAGLLATGISAAHHSTALNYSDEVITLEGTIESTRWINPHASIQLEVVNADGTKEQWLVELLAKIALERQGFDFSRFEGGMLIKVTGRVGYRPGTLAFQMAELPDGSVLQSRGPGR